MAYYPFEPQIGAIYKITNGNVVSVFNDQADPNYVGVLNEITGLDSPDVRESAEELVQADGGQHGDFYFGRRPITMSGLILNPVSELDRRTRYDRLSRSVKALRSDATLSWKPATRKENLAVNPRAQLDTSGWVTTGSIVYNGTATLTRVTGQTPPVGTTAFQVVTNAANSQGAHTTFTAVAGRVYSYSIATRRTAGTDSAAIRVADTAGGYHIGTAFPNTSAWSVTTGTFTPTTSGTHTFNFRFNGADAASTFQFSNVLITEGASTTYFDGDTTGNYWQGTPGSSGSGDFIEMYTPIRIQQPLRETGAWQKEFQIALVSEYAPLFSAAQSVVTGASAGAAVVAENRGGWPGAPILRLSAASTVNNPTITNSTQTPNGVLRTTGLALAAGETIEFDTLNHTATFIAGARSGQSANRYIDFATTVTWPCLLTGNNTFTPSGGTLSVVWRDTWA